MIQQTPSGKNLPSCYDTQYSVAISWPSSTSVQGISSTWTWQKLIIAKELKKSFLFQRSPDILSLALFRTQYSFARFFLDILGYFELTPSTCWKHFCTTFKNDFFQNTDGWIFQFRLEADRNDWLLHNRFPFDFDIQYSVAISWRSSTSVQTISSTWTWQKLTTANGPHEIFSLSKEKEPRDFVFGPF